MYRPDSIPFKRQRIVGVAEGQIKSSFSPYHAILQASEPSELTQEAIKQLLETVTMRSSSNIGKKPVPQQTTSSNTSVFSFLPTGTGADTAGTAKGAAVRFENDSERQSVVANIRSDTNPINWTLFRYSDQKTLVFHSKGEGGVEELVENLIPDHVMYGFFRVMERVDMSATIKFCFVIWQPEGIPPMKKCLISTHQGVVREAFRPYQFDFFATEKSELSNAAVMEHIGNLTGTRSHVTDRKVTSSSNAYERKMLGGVTKDTQKLEIMDEPLFAEALQQVRSDDTSTDWILAVFEGTKLKLKRAGSGGISAFVKELSSETFNYGLIRITEKIDESLTVKFCYVKYQPDSVPIVKQGRLGVLGGAVSAKFEPFHGTVFATDMMEVNEDSVLAAVSNLRHAN